jgi:hypothetical protein
MAMIVEQLVAGETEVLVENLLECCSVYHGFHMIWPGIELGPLRWEAGE